MRFLRKVLVLIGTFLCLGNVYSQGILIFEISDSRNKSVADLSIDVMREGEVYKTYTTDENGRFVDVSIPSGNYSYKFEFGDLNQDTFSVKNGDYKWINLDYRALQIEFKDDEGTPLAEKKASLSKINADGSKTLVGEKFSDVTGMVRFLLPEGEYEFSTFKGTETVTLKDENINSKVEVTSGKILHQFFFRFVKNGQEVSILTKDIDIKHIAPDSVFFYGSADVKPLNGTNTLSGYYNCSRTATPISLDAGTYECTVKTRDYSVIVDTFTVDENDPLYENVHDLILPYIPGSNDKGDENKGDEDDKKDDEEEDHGGYKLTILVLSSKDSITPIPYVPVMISSDSNPERVLTDMTDNIGYAAFGAKGDVNLYCLNDTIRNLIVTQDTMVRMYVDTTLCTKVYFDFYQGKEAFNPVSVRQITLWNYRTGDEFRYPSKMVGEDTFEIRKPMNVLPGVYGYSFNLRERNYDEMFMDIVNIMKDDTAHHIKINLLDSYNLNIVLKDINGYDYESRQYFSYISENGKGTDLLTDSLGHYSTILKEGYYTFAALGDTQKVYLQSDTTLYFQGFAANSRPVKFQFLHDGRMVYPQVMNMDIYKASDSLKYSRVISNHYTDYEGVGEAWVFDESVLCEPGEYFIEYILKDYQYNGTYTRSFSIEASTSETDTTVYIVIPVKRTVTITVKDANYEVATGVFGNIYKYDENGVLLPTTYYDDASHEKIRTNTRGEIIDLLVPGRYQLRILDIVRDFIVKDYDLNFEVVSGAKMYDVKYVVLHQSDKTPASNLLLDINKNEGFYNSSYTDEKGEVEIFCEKGNYSYSLHYGENHTGSYSLKADTTIYIYVEDPVMIDSMSILGCVCLNNNDSIPLELFIHPADATLKEVEWSVDNQALAHVTSDGVLVINNIDLDGFFNLTASAIDGGEAKVSRKFHIGDDCGSSFSIHFDGTDEVDMPVASDFIKLVVRPEKKDQFEHAYVYQASADSVKWENVYGPTQDTLVEVSTKEIDKMLYYRVLVSSTASEALDFSKNNEPSCGSDKISENTIILRKNSIGIVSWADSICSNNGEITLIIDKEKLGEMSEGYDVEWATRRSKDDNYTLIENMRGKDTLAITIDTTTLFRISIQKGDVISVSYEKEVFVEEMPKVSLMADKDTVCLGDEVNFAVTVESGAIAFYEWNVGEGSDSTRTVEVEDMPYIVVAHSRYGVCPSIVDTLSLLVDQPIDFTLSVDKTVLCEIDTVGTDITIDDLGNQIGRYVWSDSSTASTLHVVPTETSTYSVTAYSLFEKCNSVTKEIGVDVRNVLSVSLAVDKMDICQLGNDSISLTADVLSGEQKRYVWWDGVQTTSNTRTVFMEESTTPWVMVEDDVCPASDKDSAYVRVAYPSSVSISTSTSVFEYGSDIVLNASVKKPVYGPYSWYSVNAEGEETLLSITDENEYADLPSGDVSYYVSVENGACPILVSDSLSAHLADNIVIPTIFTPYTVDGDNDDFMPGYRVVIYDRYGNLICHSNNGWDGMYKGAVADPGVYMYVLTLRDERVVKGTIEVFRK